jgi:DNA-binding transcriptional MerR regulator
MQKQTWAIGALAKRVGVSVQTLRHYHRLGLLPPTMVNEAGYRKYSALDCARLELIRTLRDVGFDLTTIRRLLDHAADPQAAVRLQIDALDAQVRGIQRRRVLLNAVANGKPSDILRRLQELSVLAGLNKLEREAFLAKQLGWNPSQSHGDVAVWEAAVLNLPETLSDAQLEAWLELTQIAGDEGFQRAMERQRAFGRRMDPRLQKEWLAIWGKVETSAAAMAAQELSPAAPRAQRVVDLWVRGLARLLGRKSGTAFEAWMLREFQAASDPRIPRYWALIAQLKNLPPHRPERAAVWPWLMEGLRFRAEREGSRPKRAPHLRRAPKRVKPTSPAHQ